MISLIAIALILLGSSLFTILYTVSLQPKALSLRMGEKAFGLSGRNRPLAMIFEMVALAGYVFFPFGTTESMTTCDTHRRWERC